MLVSSGAVDERPLAPRALHPALPHVHFADVRAPCAHRAFFGPLATAPLAGRMVPVAVVLYKTRGERLRLLGGGHVRRGEEGGGGYAG